MLPLKTILNRLRPINYSILLSLLMPIGIAGANGGVISDGGVSHGGGGTTNPNPADPEWIVDASTHYSGRVLLPWLNAQEEIYGRLDQQEKSKSPFAKLFQDGRNIFDIVKSATIELRMAGPCFDKEGASWDGSIYASKPEAICISPYTMAPKLNENNMRPETIALVIHELSHLLGTTEEEARAIQQRAIWDLSKMDLLGSLVKEDQLVDSLGKLNIMRFNLGMMISYPSRIRQVDFAELWHDFLDLRDKEINFQFLASSAIRASTYIQFGPEFVRLTILKNQICANDEKEEAERRKYCSDRLAKAFNGKQIASAKEIEIQLGDITDPALLGREYETVQINNTSSIEGLKLELQASRDFLNKILQELVVLKNVKTEGYRTEK